MRHFDVQLMGGWVMLRGMLAEMETGEGKTLTATLPACTAALAGIPVHVITVNDYLVERDAEAMGPVYRALGLSVGACEQEQDRGDAARGVRLRRHLLQQQGDRLRLPAGLPSTLGSSERRLVAQLERLHRQQALGATGCCCAASASPSSTRPTAC